jgi:hypothetical protein
MLRRIVYVCWPPTEISGGIRTAFRHVETLCEHGIEAAIATPAGQTPNWFQPKCAVVNLEGYQPHDDILVFPENNHAFLAAFANLPNEKWVLCQNQFMAYRGLNGKADYSDFGVMGVICPSYAILDFAARRFPHLQTDYVPYCIDPALFSCGRQKKLQIAFAPRKRPLEAQFIRDLFHHENPDLRSVSWLSIHGVSETQVAEQLRGAAVFLSLNRFESFGLTSLEALACGCLTVGFTGWGAQEYATSANGFWVAEDDCFACVSRLADAVREVRATSPRWPATISAGLRTAANYSPQAFSERLLSFWQSRIRAHE